MFTELVYHLEDGAADIVGWTIDAVGEHRHDELVSGIGEGARDVTGEPAAMPDRVAASDQVELKSQAVVLVDAGTATQTRASVLVASLSSMHPTEVSSILRNEQ